MSQLPDEIVAALRARKLLIVWASAPLALSEREPTNRAAAINQLSEQAKNLPSITTLRGSATGFDFASTCACSGVKAKRGAAVSRSLLMAVFMRRPSACRDWRSGR